MRLCIALDLPSRQENITLVQEAKGFEEVWLKVGLRSFIRDGIPFLQEIKQIDSSFRIFLDLKLYDIPNTMADAAYEVACLDIVDMLSVHSSSGALGMNAVMDRLKPLSRRPLIFAISVLTSFDEAEFATIYGQGGISSRVEEMARLAALSGVDGMVCSVFESLKIKTQIDSSFLTLTPGIRPFNEGIDDQKRVGCLADAKNARSDFIVVGRPIYKTPNPRQKIEQILKTIEKL
ncbi:orotidine-5'-phosphate decarboxylase [Helicobacter monodelphidis]|uniref:orotidine-5'-phosphate decarboxylase n=1 Tax=Helicobacter sp. 15-1451 TaxID=2004995 RepID=UPI000DCBD9DC|nr:orotidine-5'-phosphate decarboxylase [Helicobacter sp. 15-1451]RAX59267.1 orotidine-5'-phosphate decarboxylase [Helicobacter sp. 15-1451]